MTPGELSAMARTPSAQRRVADAMARYAASCGVEPDPKRPAKCRGKRNADKKQLFADALDSYAPDLLAVFKPEYHFALEHVRKVARHNAPHKVLRGLLTDAGLRDWRFDWADPASMVAVEVDGGQFMRGGGYHGTDGDRDKGNAAQMIGWKVLRFSPQQLEREPDACVRRVIDTMRGQV